MIESNFLQNSLEQLFFSNLYSAELFYPLE